MSDARHDPHHPGPPEIADVWAWTPSGTEPEGLDMFERLVGGRRQPPSVLWPTLWTVFLCGVAAAVWRTHHDVGAALAAVICAVDAVIFWQTWTRLRRGRRVQAVPPKRD